MSVTVQCGRVPLFARLLRVIHRSCHALRYSSFCSPLSAIAILALARLKAGVQQYRLRVREVFVLCCGLWFCARLVCCLCIITYTGKIHGVLYLCLGGFLFTRKVLASLATRPRELLRHDGRLLRAP